MTLRVEIFADPDTLRAVERELRSDADLRGTRLSRIDAPIKPGEMGFVPDALQWVTDNNTLLAALAGAVAGWLGRQRQPTRVRVRLGEREIELESDRVKDADATAEELLRKLRDDDTDV
ncbi:hypothetical protein AMIS_58650 [Actinoplanes missouriensis 431]|uniref:Uncharacterized protein n=1 Tax=Actinoplanes missouriensis (strain ATCC 14538 / DSM 43046 / CBS 188.64 / JCM 3121 / NBRC 102363 / NCIMB 12654 / NRRL B-3342 / UNCC 431) TaxID=512565 RepID=I0HDJ8_ACTM4|nr:hypothetical protein [Actinoplanes missouriensis]BAL91085.1 hypothetical protein AMIS_58650 [Actinoplanes missouriensis 431]